MRLFLDTSVLLSASGSANGASRFIVAEAAAHGWELVSSDYCAEETRRNLPKLGRTAAAAWKADIAPRVQLIPASVAFDKPLLFPKAKDRPVVISALASEADWLLTLDETDFQGKLGPQVYGLRLASPGQFLLDQRSAGTL